MKPWRQVFACGLAIIVAMAGMIGLSPELHLQWEHGGVGPAHRHAGAVLPVKTERHLHLHLHHLTAGTGPASGHQAAPDSSTPPSTDLEKVVQHSFRSFTHGPEAFGRTSDLVRWLVRMVVPGARSEAGHDHHLPFEHQHDSLTQLLVEGGLEAAPHLSPASLGLTWIFSTATPSFEFRLPSVWFAPTAPRGPPASIG